MESYSKLKMNMMGSMWLPGVSPAHDIYWSFNSMRDTQGSNEWLGSQLRRNERNTNFISNSRRRFLAVIGTLIDLKQKPKSFHWILFPSSPKASWGLEFQAILTPRMARFSILSWGESGKKCTRLIFWISKIDRTSFSNCSTLFFRVANPKVRCNP